MTPENVPVWFVDEMIRKYGRTCRQYQHNTSHEVGIWIAAFVFESFSETLPIASGEREQLPNEILADETYRRMINADGTFVTVPSIVSIPLNNYTEVYFIIPDYAMSAGTVLVLSGDKIYMDYSSVMDPIDPQVLLNDNRYVLSGYLQKVDEMIEKARN